MIKLLYALDAMNEIVEIVRPWAKRTAVGSVVIGCVLLVLICLDIFFDTGTKSSDRVVSNAFALVLGAHLIIAYAAQEPMGIGARAISARGNIWLRRLLLLFGVAAFFSVVRVLINAIQKGGI
jgi:hypothetical protein